jgi:hypothetical protein
VVSVPSDGIHRVCDGMEVSFVWMPCDVGTSLTGQLCKSGHQHSVACIALVIKVLTFSFPEPK